MSEEMMSEEIIDSKVWKACSVTRRYLSKTRISEMTGIPSDKVRASIDRLLMDGNLEHMWVGWDGYRTP